MASGSSGRANNSGSKGFDFASDDVLCSYEDYGNEESTNGNHSEHVIGTSSSKDFQKSRMSRSSVFPTTNVYSQPEDSLNQEVILIVERTVKKHTDNLMRFLEGISSRLSQLELYCYNLDKSIGEMRSDLVRDHGEEDSKLRSLDKHIQEVHRSVQILRDKQELAETQKELAKLQLAQKESSSSTGQSQHEERTATPKSDSKKADDTSDVHNQQLALALPHQIVPQPAQPTRPVEQQQSVAPPSQIPQPVNQQSPYYFLSTQLPNPQSQSQSPQGPYLPADSQYRTAQMAAPPSQNQVNQTATQQFLQYQQQWPQQVPQPVQPPQQPSIPSQNQVRPATLYPAYMASQPTNTPPPEALGSSLPMQGPFSGIPKPGVTREEAVPYGYGGVGRPVQPQLPPQLSPQLPPQHLKTGFPAQPGDGYAAIGSHLPVSSGSAYMMYESEGGRSHRPPQQPHYAPGAYPPANVSLQSQQPPSSAGPMVRSQNAPQFVRNHPHNELIDKLVSMGYRGDHVATVIQRLEESGQPVDFNAVLDRLNGLSSGGSQRGW